MVITPAGLTGFELYLSDGRIKEIGWDPADWFDTYAPDLRTTHRDLLSSCESAFGKAADGTRHAYSLATQLSMSDRDRDLEPMLQAMGAPSTTWHEPKVLREVLHRLGERH